MDLLIVEKDVWVEDLKYTIFIYPAEQVHFVDSDSPTSQRSDGSLMRRCISGSHDRRPDG